MSSTLTELLVVVSTDDMNREDFCKHMTHRHPDSLGGLSELDPGHLSREVEQMYRSFHKRLHDIRAGLSVEPEHEHLP